MEEKEIKALMEATNQGSKHNWLYSFMNRTYTPFTFQSTIDTQIYLVAYCKQCNKTLTVLAPLSYDGSVLLNQTNIPKDGCEWA